MRSEAPVEPGLPLGLAQLCVSTRETRTIDLALGEGILFYTDGISEARDKSGAFYPLDRCRGFSGDQDPDTALDGIRDDVIRHVGHSLQDDAAMLLIIRNGGTVRAGNGQAGATARQSRLLARAVRGSPGP